MLFTMVSTVDHGNFILDRYPHAKTYPQIDKNLPTDQIIEIIVNHFSYFGIYPKKQALKTQNSVFSESCLLQTFIANQKRLQSVLGIDEECVIINRAMFLIDHSKYFPRAAPTINQNSYFMFEELDQQNKAGVNSISLVWIANDFGEVDAIKHRLAFFLGVIERKQSMSSYLTKQVQKIIHTKGILEKKIRDYWNNLIRESQNIEEEKVKLFIDKCYEVTDAHLAKIQIFDDISKFSSCLLKKEEYTVTSDEGTWLGSMGNKYNIPNHDTITTKRKKQIQHKTILTIQKKIQSLPPVLYHDRVKRVVKMILAKQNKKIEDILKENSELQALSIYPTLEFLISNQFAIDVYPFNNSYVNLYSLNHLPKWQIIRKFDKQIFRNCNMIEELSSYSRYKTIQNINQKDKYIILQKFVNEVDVYIYKLQMGKKQENGHKHFDVNDSDSDAESESDNMFIKGDTDKQQFIEMIENNKSINQFLSGNSVERGPQTIANFMKTKIERQRWRNMKYHNTIWGTYFVEKHLHRHR